MKKLFTILLLLGISCSAYNGGYEITAKNHDRQPIKISFIKNGDNYTFYITISRLIDNYLNVSYNIRHVLTLKEGIETSSEWPGNAVFTVHKDHLINSKVTIQRYYINPNKVRVASGWNTIKPINFIGPEFSSYNQNKDIIKLINALNKQKNEQFLIDNAKKEGIIVTKSGLQYKIITKGIGNKAALEDTVFCHYKGTLIDGKEFDSSYKRGKPMKFKVKSVIPGWVEALQLMKPGSKWRIFVPANLAYGDKAPKSIGPGRTLIFEIDLLEVYKSQENNQ